jgi:site-specific DNA-methyltransferase (adenine-specific)
MQPNAPTPNLEANVAANLFNQNTRSTDILESLANLSSDEVFTPPKVVNAMLDLLPPELWRNPEATFLDPATKSGGFLREIVKRLNIGLAAQMSDLQTRIDHILSKQIFGIATSEITGHMARRSVYCSRLASGKKSVTTIFAQQAEPKKGQGYVRYTPTQHQFKQDHCIHCGANASQYNRDDALYSYAYPFLHAANLFEYLGVSTDMKFDVIIGNPPYQLSDGGAGASAKPLYHLFVEQAKKIEPNYLCMIIPSRWYAGGKGLDDFRASMLADKRLSHLVDFPKAIDCFPSNEIKGGICYFLWDKNKTNELCNISIQEGDERVAVERKLNAYSVFIRDYRAIPILEKIKALKEVSFEGQVSSSKPFGLRTFFNDDKAQPFEGAVSLYARGRVGYVKPEQLLKNQDWISQYKVLVSKAYNGGDALPHQIIGKPILAPPNSACTETYLVMGLFDDAITAANLVSYMETRFFRFLVSLAKITQDGTAKVYQFVPIQNFNEPWTDEKLYAKYGLNAEEIAYIESMIRPMNDGAEAEAANGEAEFDSETGEDVEGVSDDE